MAKKSTDQAACSEKLATHTLHNQVVAFWLLYLDFFCRHHTSNTFYQELLYFQHSTHHCCRTILVEYFLLFINVLEFSTYLLTVNWNPRGSRLSGVYHKNLSLSAPTHWSLPLKIVKPGRGTATAAFNEMFPKISPTITKNLKNLLITCPSIFQPQEILIFQAQDTLSLSNLTLSYQLY